MPHSESPGGNLRWIPDMLMVHGQASSQWREACCEHLIHRKHYKKEARSPRRSKVCNSEDIKAAMRKQIFWRKDKVCIETEGWRVWQNACCKGWLKIRCCWCWFSSGEITLLLIQGLRNCDWSMQLSWHFVNLNDENSNKRTSWRPTNQGFGVGNQCRNQSCCSSQQEKKERV